MDSVFQRWKTDVFCVFISCSCERIRNATAYYDVDLCLNSRNVINVQQRLDRVLVAVLRSQLYELS